MKFFHFGVQRTILIENDALFGEVIIKYITPLPPKFYIFNLLENVKLGYEFSYISKNYIIQFLFYSIVNSTEPQIIVDT